MWFGDGLVIATFFVLFVTLLCFLSDCMKFHIRMTMFHLYLIISSISIIPPMLWKGRSNENIYWCKHVLQFGAWLFGISMDVKNRHRLITSGPCIIISNHQSSLDVLGMGVIFPPKCSFLAKRTLLFAGPLGIVLWLAGGIFIDRANKKKSQELLLNAGNEIKKNDLQVWIFPEGTRNASGEMLPFKKGAFNLAINAGIPIQPIVFSSQHEFYNPNKFVCSSGSFTIEILPPIDTAKFEISDSPKLAEDTRKTMMNVFKTISQQTSKNIEATTTTI